jgi:predicted transcriptional regulator of viral defense system
MVPTTPEHPKGLSAFADDLQAAGRYTFLTEEARAALRVSEIALANAARRLKERGRIVSPRRGFYVIVPAEYRTAGAPPPSWFIDDLMRYLGQPYYVALLSAAALHGASHQQAMVFQVMTDRPTRPAEVGRTRVEFHMSALVAGAPAANVQTETGYMLVSTPEMTAFDLVGHPESCGGWSNVATLLAELAERLDPEALYDVATASRAPGVQRLGYLLDQAGYPRLADPLLRALGARRYRPVRLASDAPPGAADVTAVAPWRIVPNVQLELDL